MPTFKTIEIENKLYLKPFDESSFNFCKKNKDKIIYLIAKEISDAQFHTLFDYCQFAFKTPYRDIEENLQPKFKNFEAFRDWISANVGWFDVTFIEVGGDLVKFKKIASWSFGKNDRESFNDLFQRVEKFLSVKVGTVDEFLRNK